MGNKIMDYKVRELEFSLIEDSIPEGQVYYATVQGDKWHQSSPVYTSKKECVEWMLGFEACHARMCIEQQLKPKHPYMGMVVK